MANELSPDALCQGSVYHLEENNADLVEEAEDFTDNVERVPEDWKFFGHKIPKPEIIFFSQVILIYIVVITSLINIAIDNGDSTLWISLLCSCLGYILPNPSLPSDSRLSLSKGKVS